MGINHVGGFHSTLSISSSGLRDARLRLSSSAHNIANMNTDGFLPSRVTSQSVQGGGVESIIEPSGRLSPNNLSEFQLSLSQTNFVDELVNTLLAQRAFEANAVAFNAESENQKNLIDALG